MGQIKNIVDEMAEIGCPVKPDEYVDVILEDLPQDYAHVISLIESKFETPPITEVETLLLAHESRTNRFQQKIFPSVNYSQAYATIQDCKFAQIILVETLSCFNCMWTL